MSIIFNGHYRVKHRTWLLEALRLHLEAPVMLPVTLAAETGRGQAPPSLVQSDDTCCCELVRPAGTLRIRGTLTPELLQALIRERQGGCR